MCTVHRGRCTFVHSGMSSEVENISCSQPSTCLTCWLWCYSVQPCHRTTFVTHNSLSSLPLHPTLLRLTHWHKFSLPVLLCHRSLLLSTRGLFYIFTAFFPPGPYSLFLSTTLPASLPFLLIQYSFTIFSSRACKPIAAHFSVAFPRTTLVGLGGQQAMTVVLAVDCKVTFTYPHRDSTALSQSQKQRKRGMRWEVNGKHW